MSRSQRFYVVWAGHKPGIYHSWDEAEKQVSGFYGAKHKSYLFLKEAEEAFARGNPAENKIALKATEDVGIYCDGGASPNPGPCGSGVSVYEQGKLTALHFGAFNRYGTNNIAELEAMNKAFALAKTYVDAGKGVTVYADSNYAIKAVTEWAPGWRKRNWIKADGDPVANRELVESALGLYESLKGDLFGIKHVRAHAEIEGNELADRLSHHARHHKNDAWNCLPEADLVPSEILKWYTKEAPASPAP